MRNSRRRALVLGLLLAALVAVGYGVYLASDAGRLPWRDEPTRIAITPAVDAPLVATPEASPAAAQGAEAASPAAAQGAGAASPAAAQDAPACWDEEPVDEDGLLQWSEPPGMVIDPETTGYVATLQTNRGGITIELLARDAPVTVNNIVCLARNNYYEETPFHRVLAGFVIQSGDPTGTGAGGPGYQIEDELPESLDYTRGMLAMANAGPNTNGSQFFVVLADLRGQLPKNYTIFGTVTEGMEVVDEIAAVPVEPSQSGEPSSPTEDVILEQVTIEETAPPPVRIAIGATVVVVEGGTTLRSAPGGDGGVLVAELEAGTELVALADPEELDDASWRLVRDPASRNVGYVPAADVEGT